MLSAVPFWVWGILLYLIAVGILAMRPRILSISSLFIAPFVFTLIKYKMLYSFWYWYIPTAFISSLLGFYVMSFETYQIDVEEKTVSLSGSYTVLPLFLSFFAVKFALGYLKDVDIAQLALYENIDVVVSALFSGYLFGKAFYVLYAYYKQK